MERDWSTHISGTEQQVHLPDGRYVAGVSRTINGHERSFESVVFQQGRPVLDSELNLMQSIAQTGLRELTRLLLDSGYTQGLNPLNDANANFAIFTAGDVLVDGMPFTLDDGDGTLRVNLGAKPETERTDTVYVMFYREEIASAGQGGRYRETVKRHGNLNGTNLTSDMLDPALPGGFESTRRIQRSYRAVASPGTGWGNVRPVDVDGNVVGSLNFQPLNNTAVYVAGAGTAEHARLLGTADGRVYAVAVALVQRRSTDSSTQASSITRLIPPAGPSVLLRQQAVNTAETVYGNVQAALNGLYGLVSSTQSQFGTGGTNGRVVEIVGLDGNLPAFDDLTVVENAGFLKAGGRYFGPGQIASGEGLEFVANGTPYYLGQNSSCTTDSTGSSLLVGLGLTNNRMLVRLVPVGAGGAGTGNGQNGITSDFTSNTTAGPSNTYNINLSGTASSSLNGENVPITLHEFQINSDGWVAGQSVTINRPLAGTYLIAYRATDANGQSKVVTRSVPVGPAARASIQIAIASDGQTITFRPTQVTGDPTAYQWRLTSPSGGVLTHNFATWTYVPNQPAPAGTYTIELSVADASSGLGRVASRNFEYDYSTYGAETEIPVTNANGYVATIPQNEPNPTWLGGQPTHIRQAYDDTPNYDSSTYQYAVFEADLSRAAAGRTITSLTLVLRGNRAQHAQYDPGDAPNYQVLWSATDHVPQPGTLRRPYYEGVASDQIGPPPEYTSDPMTLLEIPLNNDTGLLTRRSRTYFAIDIQDMWFPQQYTYPGDGITYLFDLFGAYIRVGYAPTGEQDNDVIVS